MVLAAVVYGYDSKDGEIVSQVCTFLGAISVMMSAVMVLWGDLLLNNDDLTARFT